MWTLGCLAVLTAYFMSTYGFYRTSIAGRSCCVTVARHLLTATPLRFKVDLEDPLLGS